MTLTQVAIITRRGVITFVALIFLGIVSAVGYRIWYNYYQSTLPPVEEKPDLKFGILPKVIFPQSIVSSSNYSYSIDTETGKLPQMPKLIKVYFIPRANIVSLLAPEESQKLAVKFGFTGTREILNPTTYKYTDSSGNPFIIDLITGNFNYHKKTATSSANIDDTFVDQNKLASTFKGFLASSGVLNEDLSGGRNKVVYNKNTPQTSNSAIVSIWPTDIEGLQIVNSSASASLISATATNSGNDLTRFPILNYIYWQVDKTTFGTYPLQPIEDAFTQLQSGLGYISQVPSESKISITKAYLAYFESNEYTPYLQPVYVFEGPNFTALVPAIKSN